MRCMVVTPADGHVMCVLVGGWFFVLLLEFAPQKPEA